MKNYKILKVILLLVFPFIFTACGGGKEEMTKQVESYKRISDVPNEAWEKLNSKKIYFGHQSVGYNLIEGIRAVMGKNPQIKLNIIETSNISNIKEGCFAHSRVGQNVNPISKINGFTKFVEEGIGNNADIACFKFCFVDIHTKTDINTVFNEYQLKMDTLTKKYPKTNFIHMTVPLTSDPEGIKGWFKKIKDIVKMIIGKENMYDNKAKFEYNKKVRSVYGKEGKLFDLAQIESIHNENSTISDGSRLESLALEYTNDGGHLNEKGQKIVAEKFLLFLVNL